MGEEVGANGELLVAEMGPRMGVDRLRREWDTLCADQSQIHVRER